MASAVLKYLPQTAATTFVLSSVCFFFYVCTYSSASDILLYLGPSANKQHPVLLENLSDDANA